ncbi:substrate-binding domain-containing protein [Treponema sp.]|uniref:substrate-binding domain-containing protein n=1 Tax=Treponema sp. TaxID=166 RepID=UPI00298EC681|nr:substrate-binding domain-containing protein [Treponema sp.]MCQ2241902.1 hypothetical protein [Treponema sp.]
MNGDNSSSRKKVFITLLAASISFLAAGIILFFSNILPRLKNGQGAIFESSGQERKNHVLVVGQADNSAFLNQIFDGAKSLAVQFNSVVELRAPTLEAENMSLQTLVDYAAMVNCDGIIAYVNPQVNQLKKAIRADGTEIPIITIGHYVPDIPQISFIGNNYSSLGWQLGVESEKMARDSDRTFIVISGKSTNPNYGNMVNNLVTFYKSSEIDSFEILDNSSEENEERITNAIRDSELKNISIICLTEEDSLRVMRVVSSVPAAHKAKVLGFGENETLEIYLKKGLLTKLVSLDPVKIGRTAMYELFEYRSRGYANNYISAEIRVRKGK